MLSPKVIASKEPILLHLSNFMNEAKMDVGTLCNKASGDHVKKAFDVKGTTS